MISSCSIYPFWQTLSLWLLNNACAAMNAYVLLFWYVPVDASCICTSCNTTFLELAFRVKGNDCLPLLTLVVTTFTFNRPVTSELIPPHRSLAFKISTTQKTNGENIVRAFGLTSRATNRLSVRDPEGSSFIAERCFPQALPYLKSH